MKKPSLKQLQAKWYKRLEKTGFVDIEDSRTGNLKGINDTADRRALYTVTRQARADYYIMATWFLNDYKFENKQDQIVWEYHTNGMSYRNIAETLNKTKTTKTDKNKVQTIINSLAKIMKQNYGVR